MNLTMPEVLREHWRFLIACWFALAAINGMPAPGRDGAPNHWAYRWLFGSLHLVAAQLWRIAAVMFPKQTEIVKGAAEPEAPAVKP